MNRFKIFVADDVDEAGLVPLIAAGFQVERKIGLTGSALQAEVSDCHGLIVRSDTRVTAALLESAPNLRVIGRAGVGVDNVDVRAATARGIVVMNAPDGNTRTTAEHTLALLLTVARKIPQANQKLKSGFWERKPFTGVELHGKTLGIIGLGRIGRVVAGYGQAFGMKVIAYDPMIAPEQLLDLEVETVTLDELFKRSDFITVHTPLTQDTRGIIGPAAFSSMKPGVRIINCARGGLIDENALCLAIKEGKVAAVALDVFETEPPAPDNPLFALDEVVVTPHLGASTKEAQVGVAITVAEQMRDFLLSGALRGSVNVPSVSPQELRVLQPYLNLADRLGRFHAQFLDGPVTAAIIHYSGEVAELDAAPVTRAFLAGLMRDMSARVNVVNAFLIAEERGISVTASYKRSSPRDTEPDLTTTVTSAAGSHVVAGALFGNAREGRITRIDGFHVEATPEGHMLITRNSDVPGVIGRVGTCLGDHGVNISRFHLGRRERGGEAIAVIETDMPVDDETLEELRSFEQIISARLIELEP